ncbi:MAG: ABC transporter ATP-binding protein [Firmicutes bacterium]|nr:ABC transporter ATP-binding protein [Bacillota bacterium]
MLSIVNIEKTFQNRQEQKLLQALKDISFTMAAGEFTSVVGPSGSGKTTLINLIAGFQRPTRGAIRLQGRLIQGPGPDRGVVFQEAALFPWLTARENIAFGLLNLGCKNAEGRRRALHYLSLMGLEDYANSYPHELSGGMKQRVALARVLALNPRVLLLDEPFGSLDSQTRCELQDLITSICWRQKTVLFITHDVEEAIILSDRILVFSPRPGQIIGDFQVNIPRPRRNHPGAVQAWENKLQNHLGSNSQGQLPV